MKYFNQSPDDRMVVKAAVMTEGGGIEHVLIKEDLGIRIEHRENTYVLSTNNQGDLVIRSVGAAQLIVAPQACNSARVSYE